MRTTMVDEPSTSNGLGPNGQQRANAADRCTEDVWESNQRTNGFAECQIVCKCPFMVPGLTIERPVGKSLSDCNTQGGYMLPPIIPLDPLLSVPDSFPVRYRTEVCWAVRSWRAQVSAVEVQSQTDLQANVPL